MATIKTVGRHDQERDIIPLFEKSKLFGGDILNHHPFLVFIEPEGDVPVGMSIVSNSNELLEFPDETKVMAQWPGYWESHWFQFTVGQWREYYNIHIKGK